MPLEHSIRDEKVEKVQRKFLAGDRIFKFSKYSIYVSRLNVLSLLILVCILFLEFRTSQKRPLANKLKGCNWILRQSTTLIIRLAQNYLYNFLFLFTHSSSNPRLKEGKISVLWICQTKTSVV